MPEHPAPERNQTDTSLRNEREKTDQELGKSGTRIEKAADAVVEHARELADVTLEAARAKASTKLDGAGATPEARASATAEQVREDAALALFALGSRDSFVIERIEQAAGDPARSRKSKFESALQEWRIEREADNPDPPEPK